MSGIWTNNWRGLKNAMLLGCYKEGLTTMRTSYGSAPAANPTEGNVYGVSPFSAYGDGTYQGGVRFGTGSGTAAATDTTLFTDAPSVISITNYQNGAVSYDVPNGAASRTIKVTIQNRSTTDSITLTEFGIWARLNVGSSVNSVMVYHEMLASPVTLIPQQTAVLELSLTMTLSDPL